MEAEVAGKTGAGKRRRTGDACPEAASTPARTSAD